MGETSLRFNFDPNRSLLKRVKSISPETFAPQREDRVCLEDM